MEDRGRGSHERLAEVAVMACGRELTESIPMDEELR